MPRSELAKLVVLLLLAIHTSIAAVLLHKNNIDPPAPGSNGASLDSFYPLSNDGLLSGDGGNNNNLIAASSFGGESMIPDEARPGQETIEEEALGYPFSSSNEGERPQSFILGGGVTTSSQCGKELDGQAQSQPNDSSKRVRVRRETGEYCEPDSSHGFKSSSPQNPTANPPQRPIQQEGAGISIRKKPSAVIPSAAEDPTINPLVCPDIERMIPVCHGMYDPVLGLGPFELEHCSPSMWLLFLSLSLSLHTPDIEPFPLPIE